MEMVASIDSGSSSSLGGAFAPQTRRNRGKKNLKMKMGVEDFRHIEVAIPEMEDEVLHHLDNLMANIKVFRCLIHHSLFCLIQLAKYATRVVTQLDFA